jgi:hypothetical protein
VEIGEYIGDGEELAFIEDYAKSFQVIKKLIPSKKWLSAFRWDEKMKKERISLQKQKRRKRE